MSTDLIPHYKERLKRLADTVDYYSKYEFLNRIYLFAGELFLTPIEHINEFILEEQLKKIEKEISEWAQEQSITI